jgi:hypothetical protein
MARKNEQNTADESADSGNNGTGLVRKITNKVLYSKHGEKPQLPTDDSGKKADTLYLGTVFGIARGIKTGQTDYGPWTKLVGQFEAHTHDGRTVQSPECILPEPMQTMLAESLADDNTESVQFAVHVRMNKADNPNGFEYSAETVVDSGRADPLADLRSKALPSS